MIKRSKKILAVMTSLVMVLAGTVGCSTTNDEKDAPAKKEASLPKEINLTYVKSPLNVPSILEKKDDLFGKEFKKDNIKVNFHELTTGPEQTQALAAGELDFLHALGGTSAIIAASNGVGLKITNIYSRSPKGYMLITNNENIKSIKDLKGKKIVGPKGTILHQLLIAALAKEGYTIDDVEYVNMDIPSAASALESKSADVAMLAGPVALKTINSGAKMIVNGEGLVSGIIVTAVSDDFAQKYPELVKRFMKVHEETLKYMDENKDKVMDVVSKDVGLSLDETKEMYSWYDFSSKITDKDIKELEDTQEFLMSNGMQEKKIDIKDMLYNQN